MKLVQLDLLAFGPFTDRSLHFGHKPGLHIVHGPNEAGKSSSLRALRCLLYGIPAQSPDDFIHKYANMRIGAVVETADGKRLEFIRRKGNKKTLRGSDDNKVFDETQLAQLLQGVNADEFRQRFGIDYEELRKGGQALVCGSGDLAEILFAAGSGVADLRAIQQQLTDEADRLFRPSSTSKPTINARLSELKDAQKAIKEAQLPTSEWCRRDEELRTAEQHRAKLIETLKDKRVEHSRLKRICDSLPLIRTRAALRKRLEQLAGIPLLPESFPAERTKAQSELDNALRAKDRASHAIAELEDQLSGVEIPAELLANRTAIEALHDPSGGYKKAAADRPRLVAERDALQQQARGLLQKLGRPPQLDEANKLDLPTAQKRRIRDLAGKYSGLLDRNQLCRQTLDKLADEIHQVQEALQQLPEPRDTAELRHTIRLAQRQGNLDKNRAQIAASLDDRLQQAEVALARLPQFDGTLEELERLPVPSAETIERYDREFAQAEKEISRLQDQCHDILTASQEVQVKLDALHLVGDVPSEADLQQARHRRDQGWQLVQQVLGGGASQPDEAVTEFIGEFDPNGDLTSAFAASMLKADTIADRLRREAERVAQQAEFTAQLQQLEEKLGQAQAALEAARQRQAEVQAEWRAQWKPAGIEPLTPGEMASWRNHQQDLVKQADEIRREQAALDRVTEEIKAHKAQLNECLAALNLPAVPDAESLMAALDRAEELATAIEDANRQREKLAEDHRRLLREHPQAERDAEDAQAALEQWRASWEDAVAVLGLDGNSQPTEAGDVIDQADDILGFLRDADSLDERIRGIDEDAARFEETVKHLLEQAAPDLIGTMQRSVEMAVAHLFGRMNQAEKDQTKVEGWQNQLKTYQAELREANQDIEHWQAKLDQLCQQAGCSAPDELPQAEEQSKQRRETERELQNVEQQLRGLAAGTPLDTWIAAVESCDADEVEATLEGLGAMLQQLESDTQDAAIRVGQLKESLNAGDGRADAAEAQAQAESLLANIRSEAEEYIRLKLASELLARAMERFREANQDPVLARASVLFAQLTRGSFTGLVPDYDDTGKAKLLGVRPDGNTKVAIEGMSDGTCDQLYLALRIALLESWLAEHEPLPFIVDDILIMFDDRRAIQALKVFAKLGEKTQVIFFTHHQHLIDLAKDAIPSDRLTVHELAPVLESVEAETAST